ncbi:hypothetical protein [Ralstonia pseudosolanacearum]|uniref:hypothetical protein n=1 Tax=Ralstonia pseudosolanacearum TaxID=1310165 RepID=UPI001CECF7BA|nr:hypothetical protein [Ralstonia pseudosolanacearum]UNJ33133.1 hypothetical protein MNY32_26155 [Ralstonia pseudosolanacearum]
MNKKEERRPGRPRKWMMATDNTVKVFIKAKDATDEVLAEIALKDGPHMDAHGDLDCTRYSLQTAFAEIFGREVRVVADSDIPLTDNPGMVFLP